MRVAVVHHLAVPATELEPKWGQQFRPADPPEDPSVIEATGPPLPNAVRAVWLTIGEQVSSGVTLFDSFADATESEPALRTYWSELAGVPVPDGAVTGIWQAAPESEQPARMIWRAPKY